jgi:hypothetical protein
VKSYAGPAIQTVAKQREPIFITVNDMVDMVGVRLEGIEDSIQKTTVRATQFQNRSQFVTMPVCESLHR